MAAPDLGLLGIAPVDLDPQTAVDAMAARLADAGFALRNGSVEVVLLEALAVAAADLVYAAGRVVPDTVAAVLGWLGLPALDGSASTGVVEVVLDPPRTVTVPAGLRMRDPGGGAELVTTSPVSVTAASTVLLPVAAAEAGPVAVAVGTAVDLLDAVPGAAAATVVAAVAGGAAAETSAEWMVRAQSALALARASLNHADQYARWVAASSPAGVRAHAVDLWDPGSGGAPGADGGHVTVEVWGPGGAWSGQARYDLAATLQGMSEAGKTVHVATPPVTTVDLAVRVSAASGADPVVVRAAAAAALRAWCDPGAWTWDAPVRVLDVAVAVGEVPGVESVVAVDSPGADVPVPGPGGLAQAGTVTVVVV